MGNRIQWFFQPNDPALEFLSIFVDLHHTISFPGKPGPKDGISGQFLL
jgi:hypothetical protein